MKTKILSLTVLLLAGAASGAFAQDQGRRDGDPQPPLGGSVISRAMRAGQSQTPDAPRSPRAPPVAAEPQAAEQPAGRGHRAGGPGSRVEGPRVEGPRVERPRVEGQRDSGQRAPGRQEADRRDWNGQPRDGRPEGGRDSGRRPDARPDDRRDAGRRDDPRWRDDRQHQDWDRNRDRAQGRDHDRDRGGHDRPRWQPHRYPPSYSSRSRFYGSYWRAPQGYYARDWRYGEILPFGWYGPEYRLVDWWSYDLPAPPPGCDWVRVGRDVMLVDSYTGRILQVVRLVFW